MSESPYYVREGFNQSGVIQLHRVSGRIVHCLCEGHQFESGTLGTVKVGVRIPQSRQGFWMDAAPDSKHKVNGSRSKTQKLLLMSIFPQRLELVNSGNLHYIPLQFSWSEHQICNLVTSVRIRVGDLLLIRLII